MTNKEFILELVRLLRPKYYNRITWLLVATGVLLIAPPLTTVILHFFIESITKFSIIGEHDILWGFLLILIGLAYNVFSQIINGNSTFKINFICNRNGNVTINQNTIVVNSENAQEILESLYKSNQSFKLNYIKSVFSSNFIELFKGFPWVKNISIERIENDIEYFKIDYETSDNIPEYFYANIFNVKDDELILIEPQKSILNDRPNLCFIYWEKWGYWTLNTYESFINSKLTLTNSLMGDISNIIGDLTFIITDLKIRLTYDKAGNSNNGISHPKFGNLIKVEFINTSNEVSNIDVLQLGLIDSIIDMSIENQEQNDDITIVNEVISQTHIFKLSSLLIRFLLKSGLTYDYKNTLIVRKSILDFMKKIEAQKSYSIPSVKTKQTTELFRQAFNGTWVFKRYEKLE